MTKKQKIQPTAPATDDTLMSPKPIRKRKKPVSDTAVAEDQQLSAEESPVQPIQRTLEECIQLIEDGKTVSVAEIQSLGGAFYSLGKYNRDIDDANRKRLESLRQNDGTWLVPIICIPAKRYFLYYPDRQVDVSSVLTLTTNSPENEGAFFVIDGNHRLSIEMELSNNAKFERTLMARGVVLTDKITPDSVMNAINNQTKPWSVKDRSKQIVNMTGNEQNNVKMVLEMQRMHPQMGERLAYALLNFNDNYRKKLQLDYFSHPEKGLPFELQGTPDNIARGLMMLQAFELGFRDTHRMLGNMAAIKMVIQCYDGTPDDKKAQCVRDLRLFFSSLSQDIAKRVSAEKSIQNKTDLLHIEWGKFIKDIATPQNREKYIQVVIDASCEGVVTCLDLR